jgi:hypothetical protein
MSIEMIGPIGIGFLDVRGRRRRGRASGPEASRASREDAEDVVAAGGGVVLLDDVRGAKAHVAPGCDLGMMAIPGHSV